MKNSKILIFLAMVILSIVSCTKENIEGPEVIDPIEENIPPIVETSNNPLVAQVNGDEDFDLGCFTIDTPFDLTVDGVISTIESVEDFENALVDAGETTEIDFVYPINITYEDGETGVVANGEELGEAFSVCVPDEGWGEIEGGFPAFVINDENSCYELSYPLTLTDLDDVQTVVADEAAFIDALANNPFLFFNFPLTLINENGEEVMAQNEEEIFALFFECEGNHPPCDSLPIGSGSIACFEVVFPINVLSIDADGNTSSVTLENENDFGNAMINGNIVGFDFPITLVDEEGNEVVINSEEEFETALEGCFGIIGEPNFSTIEFLVNDTSLDGMCYAIQFPITLTNPDGSVVITADNAQNAIEFIFSMEPNLAPVFPVSVVLASDGSTVTLENVEDLLNLLNDC